MKTGLKVLVDRTQQVSASIRYLSENRILVGVPANKALRTDADGKAQPINNAALAYIHNYGAPEAGIPARPFMEPGIKREQRIVEDELKKAGQLALEGRFDAVRRAFHKVGGMVRDSIKLLISEGIPPPLKEATVAARRRRSKGSNYRRKAVTASQTTPLIDTGAMRNAINYVIERVKAKRQ